MAVDEDFSESHRDVLLSLGLSDIFGLAVTPYDFVNQFKQVKSSSEIATLIESARSSFPFAQEATSVYLKTSRFRRISTGCSALDKILRGGIQAGAPIAFVGEAASGKTQLAYQVVADALHRNRSMKAFWLDTTYSFRPERLHELLANRSWDAEGLLQRVMVRRIVGSKAQMEIIERLYKSNRQGDLVVVDDIYTNFGLDYPSLKHALLRYARLRSHILEISKLTFDKAMFSLLLFPVRFRPKERRIGSAGELPYSSMPSQIFLTRVGSARYASYSLNPGEKVAIKITSMGVEEA